MKKNLLTIMLTTCLVVMVYLYVNNVAIQTKVVIDRQTKTDTLIVTIDSIEIKWKTIIKEIRDTTYIEKPVEVYLIDTVEVIHIPRWQELAIRLSHQPPLLELTTVTGIDTNSTLKHYKYDNITWGFLMYPSQQGPLVIQSIPKPPLKLTTSFRWGVGAGYFTDVTSPLMFGEYDVRWRRLWVSNRASISLAGLNAGIYLSW